MRVAVINTFDAKDVNNWAGICFHVSVMLDTIFENNVEYICLRPYRRDLKSYLLSFYYNSIRKKRYYTWADKNLLKKQKSTYKDVLQENFDLIITFQYYLTPLLKKNNNKVIYWNDATFKNIHNYYSGYSNFSKYCINSANTIQKEALAISDYVIYSSDWAINSAINDYHANYKKLKKISFASNLSTSPTQREIGTYVELRKKKIVTLLFLAADWNRKGGEDAVAVVEKLNENGVDCVLHVVGTDIPDKYKANERIVPFGFISKNTSAGEKKLIEILQESSFLILPTRADCTPVAFSEANSYGVPVITTDTGGIPSIIKKKY